MNARDSAILAAAARRQCFGDPAARAVEAPSLDKALSIDSLFRPYRKRPVVILAFRWDGSEVPGLDRVFVGRDELGNNRFNLAISTLERTMYVAEGDWIIRGVRDELSSCPDDVFRATHDPVTPREADIG